MPLEDEKGLGFKGIPQARHEAQHFFFCNSHMCHNLMSSCNFNVIYVRINTMYCTL